LSIGVFYPTLNVYGGAEFVTSVIVNALAEANYDVLLFTNETVDQNKARKYFGNRIHNSAKIIVKKSTFQPRGLLDFYQTMVRTYALKSKCRTWIDVYSNCIFPWTNVCYVHFPFLNHFLFRENFPYLKDRHIIPVGTIPYVFFEKNLVDYDKKLILANSHYTANEIERFSGRNAKVLYPPVPSAFYEDNEESLLRNPREDLVVTISRFGYNKDLEKIPRIALLTDSHIRFAIVGRVHYQNALLSLQKTVRELGLSERVKFYPDISRQDMKAILKKAKIYLHAMVGEHFGISIVEAMAMGCIPLVHDSGGAKEFVPECYRYKDIRDAAEKVEKNTRRWNTAEASRMIHIAYRFREGNFASQFLRVFEKYLEAG
jgi:glycosyltransferase involved in cell wall biosynthesis